MRYALQLFFSSRRKPESGRCVCCGCTDERACPDGCSWADDFHTLCSACLQRLLDHAPLPVRGDQTLRIEGVEDARGRLYVFNGRTEAGR